jgi:hypothetical protein
MRPPSNDLDAWINLARRQRIADWAAFFIDAFEPMAPLAAQMLYLVEPILGPGRSTTRAIARALEGRETRAALRARLVDKAGSADQEATTG